MDASIDIVFRIAAIGLTVSIVSQILKRAERDDMAMLATLAGLIVVLVMVVNLMMGFFTEVQTIFQMF